nr:putative retrotransposon Ty1-copia subclass protein [Tanacetum cinerariifolium]
VLVSTSVCASTPEEVAYMKKVPYASAVGSIMYVIRCTRPDVAFAQNLVSRYQQNPGKLHWVAVKHILKYLRNTRDMFLMYRDDEVGDLGEPANYKAAMLDPDKKTDMDGKAHTYKARLVAKGCTQTYGIDDEETFSPVADIRAIRILIAIAAYYDYEIWQMDVKTAFLNGRLDEDIYMEQPEGYVDPKYPNH